MPLILAIHGGPHGAYGNDFSVQFQVWAASGYAVLYTNPRGSTEYGEKHLWATWGGWGGRDYEDVMAGVDHVLARYPVDPKRLGVTGYSYGGFLTNWVITQTQRFSAAIVGAGISNWVSDYGTADIPRTKESEFGGTPWEPKGAETLLKWSPVMHAATVTTPDALRARRGRPARADRTGRADVHRAQQAEGAGAVHPLSRQLSRRLVAVEHGAPLPPGAGVVADASAGAGDVRAGRYADPVVARYRRRIR